MFYFNRNIAHHSYISYKVFQLSVLFEYTLKSDYKMIFNYIIIKSMRKICNYSSNYTTSNSSGLQCQNESNCHKSEISMIEHFLRKTYLINTS